MDDIVRSWDKVGGRVVTTSDAMAADRLIQLKRKNGSNFWPVLDEVIKIWRGKKPERYRAHVIEVRNIKRTRKNRKFASSKDKKTGGTLRYTVDVPSGILGMLRCLYSPKELPFNRKFWLELHSRYPIFRIAEKV